MEQNQGSNAKGDKDTELSFFSFDDYFSGSEVEVIIPFRGKLLPFRLKKSLTLQERQKANDAAIKIELSKDGKPVISRQDQGAYTNTVILLGLRSWPFEYRPGKPVPINMETIAKLDGNMADELATRILNGVEVDQKELDPFEKESDEASYQEEQADLS